MKQLWKVSIEMTKEITIGTIYQKSNVFPGREVGRAEFNSITFAGKDKAKGYGL